MTGAGQAGLHMHMEDKHLVFNGKLMGDQTVRQATAGSAFTVLRSALTCAWCGNTVSRPKQASVIYHRNR